jgi:shikimate dehydrogenase
VSHQSIQEIVCVFGHPVAGNPTQYVMEKAFARAGLDWRYLTLEVAPADLADAIRGLKALGFRGCNLTVPHKVAAVSMLDRLGESAALAGAVNCIHRVGNELVGENTDGLGFVESLKELVDPAGKNVVLLGAGGAACAIGVELARAGAAKLTIVNRTEQPGQALTKLLTDRLCVASHFIPWQGNLAVPQQCDVVINATTIGLRSATAVVPIEVASLSPRMIVADVNFNPPQTKLLRDAQARGCRVLDGLGMLANQAAINFRIWTGVEPDRELMRDALDEFLGF